MTEETNPIAVESDLIEPTTSEPGVMTRVGRVVFRILVAVVVGLALGVGLYYGTLRLYREVIEPIQGYEARIGDLERSLDMMRQELKTDSSDLNARQAEIEGRLAKQSEATASVEALVEAAQADLREQRTILSTVGDLSEGLDDLSLALGSVSMRVDQLEADIAAGDLSAQKVQRTAVYLRAMTLLTRARIELDRDNLGFAREQVEAAQATLNELVVSDLETKVVQADEQLLAAILERVDLVRTDLRDQPKVAGDELEALWTLFLEVMKPVQLQEVDAGGE